MRDIKKVTASIVTYNSEDEIETVLSSLIRYVPSDNIYVIDNASLDETVSIVRGSYCNITVIENEQNIGFGAAHNLAILDVNSDYHIIVNPDIEVLDGTIETLKMFMETNEQVVCCTPRILNPDGTEQYLPRKLPNIRYIVSSTFEKRWSVARKWREEYTGANERIVEPTVIETCTGCFMFVRTYALKRINGFDERFFLHFEDIDLSRRLSDYGQIVLYPKVSVIHKWHRDNLKNKAVSRMARKSMIKYFLKWGFLI